MLKDRLNKMEEQIRDMYETAECQYLNDDQYAYYREVRDKLVDDFFYLVRSLDNTAAMNTISYMRAELLNLAKDFNVKSPLDIDRLIADWGTIDGPGDEAVIHEYARVRQFCIDYPDIAKECLGLEEK